MPRMGSGRDPVAPTVAEALFTATQRRVLGLLFGQPRRAFQLGELIGLAGSGSGAVQREVARLVSSGLVTVSEIAGRKTYQANPAAPIFRELCGIVEKTTGVSDVLRSALRAHEDRIDLALLFGSFAKRSATAQSDVDVLLVSDDLTLEQAYRALAPAEKRLGRRVSPTLYTRDELVRRRRAHNAFLTKVLSGPHEVLIGSIDEAAR